MERIFLLCSTLLGALAVAMGAFGAHALKSKLEPLTDGIQRLEWWKTAAQYHLIHAVMIGVVAYITTRTTSPFATISGWLFVLGIILFSGSLYTMTLTGIRVLGAVTPLGGLSLIGGWLCLLMAAWSIRGS